MAQARPLSQRPFPFHRRILLCAAAMLASCGGGEQSSEPSAQQSLKRPLAITVQQASLAKWSAPIDLKMVAASGSVLANGKLLLWAGASPQGFGGGGRTISALFDPLANALMSRNVTETGHEMFCPGTARLPDGRLMVNGGVNAKTTSIYDPVSNVWTGGTGLGHEGRSGLQRLGAAVGWLRADGRWLLGGGCCRQGGGAMDRRRGLAPAERYFNRDPSLPPRMRKACTAPTTTCG